MNVVTVKLKTGVATIRVTQIASLEQRDEECWVYLNSGVGLESTEAYKDLLEKLKSCGWSTEEEDHHEQWLHER